MTLTERIAAARDASMPDDVYVTVPNFELDASDVVCPRCEWHATAYGDTREVFAAHECPA